MSMSFYIIKYCIKAICIVYESLKYDNNDLCNLVYAPSTQCFRMVNLRRLGLQCAILECSAKIDQRGDLFTHLTLLIGKFCEFG